MGSSSPAPVIEMPKPPDPREVAGAQTAQNVSTAIAQGFMNNVNQVTPYGTLTYDVNGSYRMTDPNTGATYDIPTWVVEQQLSPQAQQTVDATMRAETNLANAAEAQSARIGDVFGTPFEYNPGLHEEWALGLYDNLNADAYTRQDERLQNRLAQQGIMPGSEAYDRQMRNMGTSRQMARDDFLLDSYGTGMQTALTQRNQPLNEMNALLSGSQVQQPNFVNPNTPQMANVDRAGLEMQAYNQELAGWQAQLAQQQAQQAQRQNMMGGLFGLASNLIVGSDARLKTNIRRVGQAGPLGIYDYRYHWDEPGTVRRGYMAQEVARVKPEAVYIMDDGFAALDYAKLPEVHHG